MFHGRINQTGDCFTSVCSRERLRVCFSCGVSCGELLIIEVCNAEMARELAILELPKNSLVLHETHTSHGDPPHGTSWKDYWTNETRGQHTWPLACCVCPYRAATVAAHISTLSLPGIYLLPVCSECNSNPKQKQKRQVLRSSSVVVAVPDAEKQRVLQLQRDDANNTSTIVKCRNCQRAICGQTTCGGGSKIFCCVHCRCTNSKSQCRKRRDADNDDGPCTQNLKVREQDSDSAGGLETGGPDDASASLSASVPGDGGVESKTRRASLRQVAACNEPLTGGEAKNAPRVIDDARDLQTPEPESVGALDSIVRLLCSVECVEKVEILIRTECPTTLSVKVTLKSD
jgi:hypothetical protein